MKKQNKKQNQLDSKIITDFIVFQEGRLKGTDFDRNFLVLVCSLGGKDVGNFGVGSGLPADSTLDSFLSVANTVLLHNDRDALIAETVSTGEHSPLPNTNTQEMCHFSNALILQSVTQCLSICSQISLCARLDHIFITCVSFHLTS